MNALYKKLRGRKGGRSRQTSYKIDLEPEMNKEYAFQNQETESNYTLGQDKTDDMR